AAGWHRGGDPLGRGVPVGPGPPAPGDLRTRLCYTVLRAQAEPGALPWRHAAISGWVLDPDRKKMSKSVGNVVTPMDPLRQYGSDAVRYWAANGRLGADVTFDPAQLRVGRRLAIKILNASRFILRLAAPDSARGDPGDGGREAVSEPLDAAMLDRLAGVIGQCTRALDGYDHTSALAAAEEFFWFFCDDYLELVKDR